MPGAAASQPRPESAPKLRRLKPEELAGSKVHAFLFICLAMAIGVTGILVFHDLSPESFEFPSLVRLAGIVAGVVLSIRQAVLLLTLPRVTITPGATPRLGAPLPVQITLDVTREVRVEAITLTLTEREQLAGSEGRGRTAPVTNTLYSRTMTLPLPTTLPGGYQVTLTVDVPIPDEGVPSFSAQYYQLLWQMECYLKTPGVIHHLRRRIWLTVPPVRANTAVPPTRRQWFELPQLPLLQAQLQLDSAIGVRSLPELLVGQTVPFTLSICPKTASAMQKCWVESAT